ncbi:MAG: zinc finger domain-containing protein, partial [Candidatus Methylomirabilia bacterium]
EAPSEWINARLEREWERLLEVRREVARALEAVRQRGGIGSGLDARVAFVSAPEDLPKLLRRKQPLLSTLFIVSAVMLDNDRSGESPLYRYESQEIPGLLIEVDRARGQKCERCWVWSERVGEDGEYPTLCERCVPVVRALR